MNNNSLRQRVQTCVNASGIPVINHLIDLLIVDAFKFERGKIKVTSFKGGYAPNKAIEKLICYFGWNDESTFRNHVRDLLINGNITFGVHCDDEETKDGDRFNFICTDPEHTSMYSRTVSSYWNWGPGCISYVEKLVPYANYICSIETALMLGSMTMDTDAHNNIYEHYRYFCNKLYGVSGFPLWYFPETGVEKPEKYKTSPEYVRYEDLIHRIHQTLADVMMEAFDILKRKDEEDFKNVELTKEDIVFYSNLSCYDK